ncbi:iron chelate uptake ABC transporter family permease subunit [Shigella flexneri]
MLVGAALAISGAVMRRCLKILWQTSTSGVSNGAGVGLIAAVLLGQGQLPNWALGLCAIAGALLITLILLRFTVVIFRPVGYCWLALRGWDYL